MTVKLQAHSSNNFRHKKGEKRGEKHVFNKKNKMDEEESVPCRDPWRKEKKQQLYWWLRGESSGNHRSIKAMLV